MSETVETCGTCGHEWAGTCMYEWAMDIPAPPDQACRYATSQWKPKHPDRDSEDGQRKAT